MLPYTVDPLAWPFAITAMIVLFWAYTRSSDHLIKRVFWEMVRSKAETFHATFGIPYRLDRAARRGRILFRLAFLGLFASAALSIGVRTGVVRNPPPPKNALDNVDSSKFEIVTEGEQIYARPKRPTTNVAN